MYQFSVTAVLFNNHPIRNASSKKQFCSLFVITAITPCLLNPVFRYFGCSSIQVWHTRIYFWPTPASLNTSWGLWSLLLAQLCQRVFPVLEKSSAFSQHFMRQHKRNKVACQAATQFHTFVRTYSYRSASKCLLMPLTSYFEHVW